MPSPEFEIGPVTMPMKAVADVAFDELKRHINQGYPDNALNAEINGNVCCRGHSGLEPTETAVPPKAPGFTACHDRRVDQEPKRRKARAITVN